MPDQDTLIAACKVNDPSSMSMQIDLGPIYSIQSREGEVDVEMTLTSPACPAGPAMLQSAAKAIEGVEGVTKANVKLVMTPPWSPEKGPTQPATSWGIF